MEYEILNNIFTGTISTLFIGKSKEIEEQMRISLKCFSFLDTSDWVKTSGKQQLEKSLRKLSLDYLSTDGRHLPNKSYEELVNEKKKVKLELKGYDTNFKNVFGSVPKRDEKEPMRPLYVYYKKLKVNISKRADEKRQPRRISRGELLQKLMNLILKKWTQKDF